MSENEHQSCFCYLIGQKIYLSLVISFFSPLFFFFFGFFIPNLGLFGSRLEREREEINKGGKQITQITWPTDFAVTIIRKSKPARPSQPDRRLVRWRAIFLFLSFQLCQSFDLIYSKNNKSTHIYIPNTSSYRLKHSTVKHSNPSLHNIDLKHLRIMFKSEDCIYYYYFFPSFECWTDRVSLVYKNRSILLPFLS